MQFFPVRRHALQLSSIHNFARIYLNFHFVIVVVVDSVDFGFSVAGLFVEIIFQPIIFFFHLTFLCCCLFPLLKKSFFLSQFIFFSSVYIVSTRLEIFMCIKILRQNWSSAYNSQFFEIKHLLLASRFDCTIATYTIAHNSTVHWTETLVKWKLIEKVLANAGAFLYPFRDPINGDFAMKFETIFLPILSFAFLTQGLLWSSIQLDNNNETKNCWMNWTKSRVANI